LTVKATHKTFEHDKLQKFDYVSYCNNGGFAQIWNNSKNILMKIKFNRHTLMKEFSVNIENAIWTDHFPKNYAQNQIIYIYFEQNNNSC